MSERTEGRILWEADFDPRVRRYWLLSGSVALLVSVVGIPFLPLWWIFGGLLSERYLRHMRCVLTEKTLQFSKGVLFRTEKTIPLDKITDLGLVQGPVMRHYELEALSVETAGQSSEGALVKLVGIVRTRDFRDAVLSQRDRLAERLPRESTDAPVKITPEGGADEALAQILATLLRIEEKLAPPADQ